MILYTPELRLVLSGAVALEARQRTVRPFSYTQFAIQDSGLFGPNPWKFLAQIVYAFP